MLVLKREKAYLKKKIIIISIQIFFILFQRRLQLVKLDYGWLVNETQSVPHAKVAQQFCEFAPLYFPFLILSDWKCLSFLNLDLHLFIVHQRSSFSFPPLHQLPITTPQRSVVCFWGFLNILMWGAGIECGGGVDGWSTSSDGDSSEISKRSEVKVKRSKKNPSALFGSPSLMMIWGLLAFCPGFWSTVYAMINCVLTVDTQCKTYTHLTRTFTLQQLVFSCVNPCRWTPAVHLYVFQSFVTVIQAENSRTKTDNATLRLN